MTELRAGDQGILVQYLQLALTRAGIPTGVDGIFGEATCRSLQAFFHVERKCNVSREDWEQLIPYLKGYFEYEIQRGDTLWNIAAKYRTEIGKILTANPGINPAFLRVGQKIMVPFGFPVVPENVNYSSILNDYVIEGLTVRYPFLKKGSIGKSVMGKEIPFLQIGNGSRQVFYNGSFHANEWITTPVLLRFAEEYAGAYAAGRQLGGVSSSLLFLTFSLFLLPMVNPDGVDLVNGVPQEEKYSRGARRIAADYPDIPFPDGWKANIAGTDLNLQFPAGWELARTIKYAQGYTSPAPRDYVGTAPLSAPESRAVYDFTKEHDFLLILAYHTQGETVYWKYRDYEPKNSRQIAEYFGKVSGYAVEETPEESGNAGYKDWFIQEYNRPGYTIEAGKGENPLPIDQFPQIYRDNFGIMLGGMTQSF